MTECIAMMIGVLLGAGIVFLAKHEIKPEKKTETAEISEAGLAHGALQKQIENFFNYDGTGNGQKSIGDDD